VRWGNFEGNPPEVTRDENRVRHWVSREEVDWPGRFGEDQIDGAWVPVGFYQAALDFQAFGRSVQEWQK
jgi:hypothetical protein